MTDLALTLNHLGHLDLIEAFCSHDSMMAKTAQLAGLTTERWTIDDYDLSTEDGYRQAEERLRENDLEDFGCHQSVDLSLRCKIPIRDHPNRSRG